jgi:hypothetical protein
LNSQRANFLDMKKMNSTEPYPHYYRSNVSSEQSQNHRHRSIHTIHEMSKHVNQLRYYGNRLLALNLIYKMKITASQEHAFKKLLEVFIIVAQILRR